MGLGRFAGPAGLAALREVCLFLTCYTVGGDSSQVPWSEVLGPKIPTEVIHLCKDI